MTELQTMRVRALIAANLGQNRRAVSFVADLSHIADRDPERRLTDRQAGYLVGLCWSFRRQIPAALRDLLKSRKSTTAKKSKKKGGKK